MSDRVEVLQQLIDITKVQALKNVEKYPLLEWALKNHTNDKNERMEFVDRPFLLDLYKSWHTYEKVAVEKSVQVGLSELFIASAHLEANKGMSVFYVLPKYEIRNRFVSNRIARLHKRNLFYRNKTDVASKEEGSAQRKSLVGFGPGIIAFVGSNVEDEFIEFPADSAYIDEKDRCTEKHLDMVPDRLSASKYQYQREISNPTIRGKGIDARFETSSQALWNIKCEACNEYFTPNFFKHVVTQTGQHSYDVLDSDYEIYQRAPRLIHTCGKPVNRLKEGQWVDTFPGREWKGFRISQLYSKTVSLGPMLWAEEYGWLKAVGNAYREQVFINNRLGLPYSGSGAVISEYELNKLQTEYKYPMEPSLDKLIIMGVDVGSILHVVVREVTYQGDMPVARLMNVMALNDFESLKREIRRYQPRSVVVDAHPEIHEVTKLKRQFNMVWSCNFANNKLSLGKDKKERIIRMDRTAALDYVMSCVNTGQILLPIGAKHNLDNGFYYKHMLASTRLLVVDERSPADSKYIWDPAKKEDHYFLAEAYCLQAMELLSNVATLRYYSDQADKMASEKPKENRIPYPSGSFTVDQAQQDVYDNAQAITPNSFLKGMDKTYDMSRHIKSRPETDIEAEILQVAMNMNIGNQAASVIVFARAVGLTPPNALKFLHKYDFHFVGIDMFYPPVK